jgi:DMSO/TMAO reductase YedYZ molybdopterin-dependent catalytic subunit
VNDHQPYQQVVTIYCVQGWNAKILWQGILVKDLLQEAGVSQNATVIIFHASDGYTTALPVSYILQNNI